MTLIIVAPLISIMTLFEVRALRKQIAETPELREERFNEEYELSDFDARIIAFDEELNASYTTATPRHKDTYNIPHSEVTNTTLKFTPEYSD